MKPLFGNRLSESIVDKLMELKKKPVYPHVGLWGTVFLALLSIGLAVILMPSFTLPQKSFVLGESAKTNIKAYRSFEIADEKANQELQDTAESAVKSVYDYDPKLYSKTIKKLFKAFERMKKDFYMEPQTTLGEGRTRKEAKKAFEETLGGIYVDEKIFSFLEESKFNWRISWTVTRLLNLLKERYIVADRSLLDAEIEKGIAIRNFENKSENIFHEFGNILNVTEAKRIVLDGQAKIYKDYHKTQKASVGQLAASFVMPNLVLNQAETKQRKIQAIAGINPIVIKVDKGEIIVKKGEPIQKRHLVILEGIRRQFTEQRPGLFIFFTAIFLFFLFQIISTFALTHFSRFKLSRRDVLVLGVLMIAFFVVIKVYLFSMGAIADKFTWIPGSVFIYLIPIAAAAIMIRFLMGMEVALISSLLISVALGLLFEKNFLYAVYALSNCLMGIQAIIYCRAHKSIYKAGLKVGLTNVAVVFSIVTLESLGKSATYDVMIVELICGMGAGFLSGIFASVLVVTLTPLVEYVFGYTTDVKLLELSNLNNPVLRELMIRAPGSYHHSLMVGTLAENAADAIGADALLARVGGYYHDIGKMKNPHYYIENQFGGFNIHDRQPAHLSKTMIMSHVKAGIKMGIERRLGQRIVDVIAQHHGTTLLLYFYDKAKEELKEQQKEEAEHGVHQKSVGEDEYRYEGPRPGTVEAAIVMMADSVEAATRAMNTSHLPRLRVVCEKIVNRLFTDGQLNECHLTLSDLSQIVDSFYHVLVGIYHRRISYPAGGVKAEQPSYDAVYYPRQTKKDANSKEKDSEVDEDSIFKKMGT